MNTITKSNLTLLGGCSRKLRFQHGVGTVRSNWGIARHVTRYKQMKVITKADQKAECKAAELCRQRVCCIVYVECIYIYYTGIDNFSKKER
jgi:hypothetical protein